MPTSYDISNALTGKYSVRLRENRAIFDWCIRNARRCVDAGTPEEALQWSRLGAHFAFYKEGIGLLVSVEMEQLLLEIGQLLPIPVRKTNTGGPQRWLHVLTEAYSTFGHTALVRRWIENDTDPTLCSVILLAQSAETPRNLAEAVHKAGGRLITLDPSAPMLERAQQLRQEAWENADRVVLHIHPHDPIASVAFGIEGGPSVLQMNHADHTFWYGAAVSDVILNIRGSGQIWTEQYRGISRNTMLPIPLTESKSKKTGFAESKLLDTVSTDTNRAEARRMLNLPQDAFVFLTVGNAFKYTSTPYLDFLKVAQALLQRCPRAYIVAVGPSLTGDWIRVHQATSGRLLPVGIQTDLAAYHAAADVYLESMPCSSLTALLEAGLAGIPCVRAPQVVPPTIFADGVALDDLEQPADAVGYVEYAVALLEASENERIAQGQTLATRLREHHCGEGWRNYLKAVKSVAPSEHQVYSFDPVAPFPEYYQCYWAALKYEERSQDIVDIIVETVIANTIAIYPQADAALYEDLQLARQNSGLSVDSTMQGYTPHISTSAVHLMTANMRKSLSAGQHRKVAFAAFEDRDFMQARRSALQSLWSLPQAGFKDQLLLKLALKTCFITSPLKPMTKPLRKFQRAIQNTLRPNKA